MILIRVLAILLFVSPVVEAQKRFEVVSVKPNVSDDRSDPRVSPTRFSWMNASLRQLIQVGYGVRPFQLIGLPDWTDAARFDVMATTSAPASPQDMNAMLQGVLSDRFTFTAHRDRLELPVYALVLSRRHGKLGPGIRSAHIDCESVAAKPLDSGTAQADYADCTPQMGLSRLKAPGLHIASLAGALMRLFDRAVVDKTGLSGAFDIELSWTPDPTMLPPGSFPNVAVGGPSIFTALDEQLGLKLVSDRKRVDVLVVDHIDSLKPDSAN